MTEDDFLAHARRTRSRRSSAAPSSCTRFTEPYFGDLHPNEELDRATCATLRDRGLPHGAAHEQRAEWEPRWRAKLPVDELFEVVVDSAFVGHAQARPGDLRADAASASACRPRRACSSTTSSINCDAARELGMTAVHFRDTEQAIAEVRDGLETA